MTTEELAAMAAKAEEWSDPDADVGEDPMRFVDRVMAAFPSAVAESSALRSERDEARSKLAREEDSHIETAAIMRRIRDDRDALRSEVARLTEALEELHKRATDPDVRRGVFGALFMLQEAAKDAGAALSPRRDASLTEGSTVEGGDKQPSISRDHKSGNEEG